MAIPIECKMPDLSNLKMNELMASLIISRLVDGSRCDLDKKLILYRNLFVRLVEKAIWEYSRVRETIINQIDDKRGSIYIFTAINHLENCINSVKRLINLFERIQRNKENPFSIDRTFKGIIKSYSSQIEDSRNSVEHMDEHIQKVEIKDGQTIALDFNIDASKASIGKFEISLLYLAKIITKFYEFGSEFAKYKTMSASQKNNKVIKKK